MKTNRWLKTAVALMMVFASTVSVFQTGLAGPGNKGYGGTNLVFDPHTGALAFVGTNPGQPLPSLLSNPRAATARANAEAFIGSFTSQLGLGSATADLALNRAGADARGRMSVRYHQVYQGLAVFATDVIINTDSQGAMTSLTAKTSPKLTVDTNPAITAENAAKIAVDGTAKFENVAADQLTAGTPELQIYDSRLLLDDGLPARLVWKVQVTAKTAPINEVVLVDAHLGTVPLHYNQIDRAFGASGGKPGSSKAAGNAVGVTPRTSLHTPGTASFHIYDMLNKCDTLDTDCITNYGAAGTDTLPGATSICDETTTSACDGYSDPEAATAYTYAVDTYNFYYSRFGRDSYDNLGATLISSINYGTNYPNAYWDGTQMVYGNGYATADDVVGHELTHAVTDETSGLVYFAQPGAINESLSDVFGELIDQTNGHGTDTVAKKWLVGEDLPIGAIRSMSNPPLYHNPDRIGNGYFYVGFNDNAGVHTNSGVNNKAAFLMTDGGVFNGKTISGLGITKTADIYYEVETNLLGTGANYFDLYYALNQACTNLIGTDGISAADCLQVKNITDATQMNLTKSTTLYPVADYCPTGQELDKTTGNLFFDDFEAGLGNWTVSNPVGTGSDNWFANDGNQGNTDYPYGIWPFGAASGVQAMMGGNVYLGPNESIAAMTNPIAVPASGNPYFHFEHSDMFDYYGSYYYDGGRVEYSVDSGPWTDAAPLFSAGRNYTGTIVSAYGNPLGGLKGFSGYSLNYTGTRYNLASLRGHSVQFRFLVGNDTSLESYWGIDNVRIYECVGIPALPMLLSPANTALLTSLTPILDWNDAVPNTDHYQLQVDNDPAFGSPEIDQSALASSTYTVTGGDGLAYNTKYYWRVQAFNTNGTSKGWSAARYFRTPLPTPVLSLPADASTPFTDRPTFSWGSVTGATNYTIQISKNNTFSMVVNTGTATGPSYTPAADLPRAMTLYWRVRANGANSSPYSAPFSFLSGNSPTVPVQLLPAANALSMTYTPTLSWKAVTLPLPLGSTTFKNFEVQVDDTADFSSTVMDDTSVTTNLATNMLTVSPALSPNTTYYWRVRAYINEGGPDFSGWSTVRTFRTAMSTPVTSSPTGGVNTHTNRPSFSWGAVSGATSYTIQISKNSIFTMVVNTGTTSSTSYTPAADLPRATTLYWRVRANGTNMSNFSAGDNFVTGNSPSTPVALGPVSGYLALTNSLTLSWKGVTLGMTPPTTFSNFVVQVSVDPAFGSTIVDDTSVTTNMASNMLTVSPALTPGTTYYWRVAASETGGDYSGWSAVRTIRAAYSGPSLTAPVGGAAGGSLRPVFTWSAIGGATGYTIQISKNSTFTLLVLNKTFTGGATYIPTVNLPMTGGSMPFLYWRVRANGAYGPGNWSNTESFTVP